MHWLFLGLAIAFEIVGTTCLKLCAGFTRFVPSVLTVLSYGICFFLFSIAVKKIEISVSYAIWSGVGTAAITVIGVFCFHEAMTFWRVVGILAIIGGVVACNLSGVRQ
jgi:small multidrug resistance pump